jgi:hypothetical protein
MMKIGLGQAEGSDTALVTDTIITTCREQVGADQPKAGLVFAGPHFDHVVMLEKICSAFPGMVLVGCTTSGDYTSAYGFSDDSISLMVICAGELEFGAGLGKNLSLDYRCAVEVAYSMARGTLQDDPSLCLAFPHGQGVMPEPLLDYLNTKLGAGCPVFGEAAGKLLTDNTEICQFCNREVVSDGLPLLLIFGPVRYDFFLQQENVGHSFSVAVGDITGHGVDAALLMTSARAFLRMHPSRDESIVEIVESMNPLSKNSERVERPTMILRWCW